jgi:hypothetical protein
MRQVCVPLLVAGAVAVAAPMSSAATSAGWRASTVIQRGGVESFDGWLARNRRAAVVWSEGRNLFVKLRGPAGRFDRRRLLRRTRSYFGSVHVVIDGRGNGMVVWEVVVNEGRPIPAGLPALEGRQILRGRRFGPVRRLGRGSVAALLADARGNRLMLVARARELVLHHARPSAGWFTSRKRVATGNMTFADEATGAPFAALAVDARGDAVVAWERWDLHQRKGFMEARARFADATLGPTQRLASAALEFDDRGEVNGEYGVPFGLPIAGVGGRRAIVSWTGGYYAGEPGFSYVTGDAGGRFGAPRQFVTAQPQLVDLAVDSRGNAVAAFQSDADFLQAPPIDVVFGRLDTSFGPSQRVVQGRRSGPPGGAGLSIAFTTSGAAILAWTGVQNVYAARLSSDRRLSARRPLGPPGDRAPADRLYEVRPALFSNARGDVLAVFLRDRRRQPDELRAALYTAP